MTAKKHFDIDYCYCSEIVKNKQTTHTHKEKNKSQTKTYNSMTFSDTINFIIIFTNYIPTYSCNGKSNHRKYLQQNFFYIKDILGFTKAES